VARSFDVRVLTARWLCWGSVAVILAVAHFELPRFWAELAFAALIYAAAVRCRHRDRSLLDWPIVVYLGQISFSVFMVHAFCMTAAAIALDGLLGTDLYRSWQLTIWFASVGLVYVVSALSFRYIEVPCRRIFSPRERERSSGPRPLAA
jgi:peptidoglycan/LPS O-acetylase OafA/YrhL